MFAFLTFGQPTTTKVNEATASKPAVVDFGTLTPSNDSTHIEMKHKKDESFLQKALSYRPWGAGQSAADSVKQHNEKLSLEHSLTNINNHVLKMKKIEVGDSEFIEVANGSLSYAEAAVCNIGAEFTDKTTKEKKKPIEEFFVVDQDAELERTVTDMEMVEDFRKRETFINNLDPPPPEDEWDLYSESKVSSKTRKKKNLKKGKYSSTIHSKD